MLRLVSDTAEGRESVELSELKTENLDGGSGVEGDAMLGDGPSSDEERLVDEDTDPVLAALSPSCRRRLLVRRCLLFVGALTVFVAGLMTRMSWSPVVSTSSVTSTPDVNITVAVTTMHFNSSGL